ncbi:MAG: hypothetical protein WKF80_11960 [Thermomicrobiales bacterium]
MDPRKTVQYDGIHFRTSEGHVDASIVYSKTVAGGSVSVGKAVRLTGNRIFGLATTGTEVAGRLVLVESDGVCTVQVGGFMELPAAAAIPFGSRVVGGVVAGNIRALAAPSATYVASEGTEAAAAKGQVWDGSVPASIVVYFP